MADDDLFKKCIDRSRLDRLEGDILAFVSDAEADGYTNIEIARALMRASLSRVDREKNSDLQKNFMQFQRDWAAQRLARYKEQDRTIVETLEKIRVN